MKTKHGGWREEYRQDEEHDAYALRKKPPEPTRCPGCGAVFTAGRWTWKAAPADAHELICPACHRIRDRYPAGYVRLSGAFFDAHRDEILRLIRHCEEREKAEHPLERIMAIEDVDGGTQVTTTGIHLARVIGEAVQAAYKGDADFQYNREDKLLRVNWSR
ncbi:MAG: BCAM0308 family protein [Sutterellaceae bacterium]|nr:BCAM0308 family protein [Burkholderiaceae bacterium]MCX7901766.1 BCAM0308 family protein [Burkholderiaceae bacterium]MDW8430348.1 BCAM0308 family protein [Sutterellaceae bacterium]